MVTTLENFPDEILLLICRYLSSIDTLFAFHDLNSRLSQTISGYGEDVFIGQTSYPQLTHICSSMLTEIGLHVRSLIINNEWVDLVSKLFLEYFGKRMSSTFPQLERLTLVQFTAHSLRMFLDCLTNLSKLTELNIPLLNKDFRNAEESWILLHQIFTCNNNRFKSIAFSEYLTQFTCKNEDPNRNYPNIEKLTVNLNSLEDLYDLLAVLPKIHSLDVMCDSESNIDNSKNQQLVSAYELKELRLRLFGTQNSQTLTDIIKCFPNVENLFLFLISDDPCIVVNTEFFNQLSSLPLKVLNYFLFYTEPSISTTTLYSIWQQYRPEPICIEPLRTDIYVLYTLPPIQLDSLFSCILAEETENSSLLKNYGQSQSFKYIFLELDGFLPDIAATFPILTRYRRIKRLELSPNENAQSILDDRRQINLEKLPHLTSLSFVNHSCVMPKNFSTFIEASPNLYELKLYLGTLRSIFEDDSICQLLGQQITHLRVRITSIGETLDDFPIARLASVFPDLKYLCLENWSSYSKPIESLIFEVVDRLSEWNSLVSFSIRSFGLMDEIRAQGAEHWISEHMLANDSYRPFLADYTDGTFRLWV